MQNPPDLLPIPFVFLFAVAFAYGGWYYFFNTSKVCDMIAAKGWPRFLARIHSGRSAYLTYKVTGVVCFLASLFILGIAVWRMLGH